MQFVVCTAIFHTDEFKILCTNDSVVRRHLLGSTWRSQVTSSFHSHGAKALAMLRIFFSSSCVKLWLWFWPFYCKSQVCCEV